MALGVPAMDLAHEAFIGELAALANADREQLAIGISSLITSMERDFCEEEALMASIAFPALESHREQHCRALDGLKQAYPYIINGDLEVGHATIAQLTRWFLIHLSTMDLALAVGLEMSGKHLHRPPAVFLREQLSHMLNTGL
jgi:hemerythrin-like metal-binding protein